MADSVTDSTGAVVQVPAGQTVPKTVVDPMPDGYQRGGKPSAADNNQQISSIPTANPKSSDALDALFRDKGGDPKDPASNEPYRDPKKATTPPAKEDDDEIKNTDPAKPAGAAPAADGGAKGAAGDAGGAAPAAKPSGSAKPAEAPKTEDKPKEGAEGGAAPAGDDVKKLNEALDTVQLGPNAKPKTGEAFGRVKEIARETVSAIAAERDAAVKRAEEAEKKLKDAPDTEAIARERKELEDLRKLRGALEVDSDPKWKEFDTRVEKNNERILARLKDEGMSDEQIENVKKLGPKNVKWDPIFQHMTIGGRRVIEKALLDSEDALIEKREGLEAAKKDSENFLKERREAAAKATVEVSAARDVEVKKLIDGADFLKLPDLPKDANDEAKKNHEAHVKRIGEIKNLAAVAASDDSPETYASLVYGTMLAHYYSDQLRAQEALHKSEKEAFEKEKEALAKEKTELEEKLAKIRRSSKGSDNTPSERTTKPTTTSSGPTNFRDGSGALDRLRDERAAATA